MKEKNLLLRTLTCVIGVPLVLSLVYFVPQYNFILFSLFVVAFCFIGSLEMSKLLFKKTVPAAVLGPLVPLVQYLQGVLDFNSSVPDLIFVLVLLLCFASEIKLGEKDDFDSSLARASKNALIIIYPSYFISFFIRLMALPQVTAFAIISFLLLVFCNDMLA
ncbi:MAG: phosphatidate cytidylyltransferase, partial [Sphaerochaetaceae bacterium]|nr:phosphatidate cytidylyltransferase [Sphaerochaetaceae bacterium]